MEDRLSRLANEFLTRMPLTTHILPYFGYANRCARLMLSFTKKSRQLFLRNIPQWQILLKGIFQDLDYGWVEGNSLQIIEAKFYTYLFEDWKLYGKGHHDAAENFSKQIKELAKYNPKLGNPKSKKFWSAARKHLDVNCLKFVLIHFDGECYSDLTRELKLLKKCLRLPVTVETFKDVAGKPVRLTLYPKAIELKDRIFVGCNHRGVLHLVADWVPLGFVEELRQLSVADILGLNVFNIKFDSETPILLKNKELLTGEKRKTSAILLKWCLFKGLELHSRVAVRDLLEYEEFGDLDELIKDTKKILLHYLYH